MTYDALNRVQTKSYASSLGTPAVQFCYDGQTYSGGGCSTSAASGEKGYLMGVGNTTSSSAYLHQALGLVQWSSQTTDGATYSFNNPNNPGAGYVYDAAGHLTDIWYPSGRHLTYGYDGAGRVTTASGVPAGGTAVNYVTNVAYQPYQRQTTLGNGLLETLALNNRLQTSAMEATASGSLWKLENFYCASQGTSCSSNNGNVVSQRLTAPQTAGGTLVWTTAYGYDAVNRLTAAQETVNGTSPWTLSYGYGDQFGNMTASGSAVFPLSQACPSYDAATNRCNGTGFQYDNGTANGPGNLTGFQGRTLAYDAENRQISLTDSGAYQYSYDGEGRRVMKVGGSQTVVYVYDAMGQLAAEYGSAADPAGCATCYLTADHLGSTRLVTDGSGQVMRRYDYVPFGWEINSSYGQRTAVTGYVMSDGVNPKFTGKERDYESGLGLDYFGYRYLSSAQGRWTSPDQPLVDQDPANPQSWNLYGYVRNNPLANIDPTGQDCITTSNQTSTSVSVSVAAGGTESGCTKSGGAWVAGTVDMKSLTYNGSSVGYSYAPYDTNSLTGAGTIPLGNGPVDALSPSAQEFYNQMSARTQSSNHMIAEFGMAQVGFAGAYVGTYAGPAIFGALTAAGGEAGFLKFGSKAFELVRDFQGRIHGDLPEFVPKDATRDELELAASELKQSLQVRQQAMQQLGELGNHGLRIAQEQRLLYQIEQRLGRR